LAGVLIALGCGIYQVQPPEPMCVIEAGWLEPQCFISGGRNLVTLPHIRRETVWLDANRIESVPIISRLQVWGTHTGGEIASYLSEEKSVGYQIFSRDGRYFAAEILKVDADDKEDLCA
jgi:hypothetical protein